jgi:hypothetical protein
MGPLLAVLTASVPVQVPLNYDVAELGAWKLRFSRRAERAAATKVMAGVGFGKRIGV